LEKEGDFINFAKEKRRKQAKREEAKKEETEERKDRT
jgi:hypothetical protein